jgi:hypothetical protein
MPFHQFTADQRNRLANLGLIDKQIENLRRVAAILPLWLDPPAAKNAIRDILEEVESLSSRLSTRLRELVRQRDKAHGVAHGLIETIYWGIRPDDCGATSSHNLLPRLAALNQAANDATRSLPPGQTRSLALWQPIAKIDDAMRNGWRETYPATILKSDSDRAARAPPPPYPRKLKPAKSPASVFFEICCICYARAGYDEANPEAAIRHYIRRKSASMKAALEAIDKANPSRKSGRDIRGEKT